MPASADPVALLQLFFLITLGDLNGDGRTDLVATNGSVSVLVNASY
jgi:FG-GAP repeat